MNIDDILKEIEADSVIDRLNLDSAALSTPRLHAKYLNILSVEKSTLRRLQDTHDKPIKDTFEYYTGKSSAAVYKNKPFNLKILKGDLDTYINADEDIISSKSQIDEQNTKIYIIQEMIKGLHQRSFMIKNAIDWIKHLDGN